MSDCLLLVYHATSPPLDPHRLQIINNIVRGIPSSSSYEEDLNTAVDEYVIAMAERRSNEDYMVGILSRMFLQLKNV